MPPPARRWARLAGLTTTGPIEQSLVAGWSITSRVAADLPALWSGFDEVGRSGARHNWGFGGHPETVENSASLIAFRDQLDVAEAPAARASNGIDVADSFQQLCPIDVGPTREAMAEPGPCFG